jgi:membrane protein DedA with SNARE-associated domain
MSSGKLKRLQAWLTLWIIVDTTIGYLVIKDILASNLESKVMTITLIVIAVLGIIVYDIDRHTKKVRQLAK